MATLPSVTPARLPPLGVVPNLEHPQGFSTNIFFIEASLLLFIMYILLGFRVYTKTRIDRKATLDDPMR